MADQRKVEAGREKLAAYKKKKREPASTGKKSPKLSGRSPDISIDASIAGTSMTSNESASPSSHRQDVVQKLTTRVKDLEELLAGKTAAMQAMQERLDTSTDLSADLSTGMLSFSLEADYKTHLERYQHRLEEFSAAVTQRDELITELTSRLSTFAEREARQQDLAEELALLQRQLRATRDLVQGTAWDSGVDPQDFLDLQHKILAMEDTINKNQAAIENLSAEIQQKDTALREKDTALQDKDTVLRVKDMTILEKDNELLTKAEELRQKAQELREHKAQASAEVVELMRAVEDLNQQADHPAAPGDQLRLQLEEDFGIQLQRIKEELRLQSAAELARCRQAHIVELDMLRTQNETLELELDRLGTDQAACKSELDACKDAFIAQWGADDQVKALREKVASLTAQLEMQAEVRSLRDSELSAVTEASAALGRQAEEAAAANDALRRENALAASQAETYKTWLDQRTQMSERSGRDVFDLQKELSDYKNQLERLDNRHAASSAAMRDEYEGHVNELNDKLRDVGEVMAGIKEECESYRNLSASHLATCQKYEERIKELSAKLSDVDEKMLDKEKEIESYKSLSASHSTTCQKYEEQIKALNAKLEEVNKKMSEKEEECKSYNSLSADHLVTCQKYEEQIKALSEMLEEVNKKISEGEKERESYNSLSADHLVTCQKYEERIKLLNEMLEEVNKKISEREKECELYKNEVIECKENMKDLDDSQSSELAEAHESYETELKNLHNTHRTELEDLRNTYRTELEESRASHRTELEDLNAEIQALHGQLSAESTHVGQEVDGPDQSPLPALRIRIRDLQNLVKRREEAHGSVQAQLLDSAAKLHAARALLDGKEELEQSLVDKDLALGRVNQSFASLEEAKAALEKRAQDLEEQLRAAEVGQSERNEAQNENELIAKLRNRIEELEKSLQDINVGAQALRETLQETVVQCLSAEAVCNSKDELIAALNVRVQELEDLLRDVNERAASMNAESSRMMTQVAKAKELLKRSKAEREDMIASSKRLEDDAADARRLLAAAEAELAAARVRIDDLDFVAVRLEQLEKDNEEMAGKCDGYEAEVGRLRELLASSETSLEGARQELCNNRAPPGPEPPASRVVDRREMPMLGAGDCGVSFLGASFSVHNATEYLEVAGWDADGTMTLVDNYARLENERHQLADDAEAMQARLEERELAIALSGEEAELLKTRCAELEAAVGALRCQLAAAERNIAERDELEVQVETLSRELQNLKAIQEELRRELCAKQVAYEERVHEMLREQLSRSASGDEHSIEDLIYELGSRAKEVVVLREALRSKEQGEEALNRRLQESEDKSGRLLARLSAAEDEVSRAGLELDAAWADHRRAEAESAAARRELAVAALANRHLNDSLARSRQVDSTVSLDQAKTALVKLALLHESAEPARTESPTAAATAETDGGLAALRDRLAGIFSRPAPARSDDRPAHDHAALMAELAFYRDQHATLAEVLGSTGVLQEVLHRQKQQLVLKLEEKASVQQQLERERSRLSETELRLAMLEQTLLAKDTAFAELDRQKRSAEDDLRRIEEQLRDKEDSLLGERHALEAQIRDRDLRIRHWQLQCRANQLSSSQARGSPTLAPPSSTLAPALAASPALDRLDAVRRDLNVAHDAALARLKRHLLRVFSVQETELQARHAGQVALAQEQHRQQLTTIQQQLEENCKDLESKLAQIHKEKDELDVDLEEMKIKLDGSQKEVFDVLQKKFKVFGQKQMTAAIERVKSEHERMVANLTVVHSQELVALQYKLEQKNIAQLLLTKQELLQTYESDLKEVEQKCAAEIARVTEAPKLHPTDSKSALDLLKLFLCAEFTQSFQALADARYGQYEKELSELSAQLEAAMKLEQPKDRDEAYLLLDTEEELIEQTQGLLESLVVMHARLAEALGGHVDAVNGRLLAFLELVAEDVRPAVDAAALRAQLAALREEVRGSDERHRTSLSAAQRERDEAVARLDRLLSAAGVECGTCTVARAELEARHRREVEELRTYFEQKCADVEKHYSEEVFSQHSRKLSTGSSSCENELVADMFFGPESRSPAATGSHVCDSLDSLGYKEAEAQCRREYEARLSEYRAQLATAKSALEDGCRAEMAELKKQYDDKLDQLARDLADTHQASLLELESKHGKELDNARTRLEAEAEAARTQLREQHQRELAQQVDEAMETVKVAAEQEQEKFMRVQKEMMSGFLLQHDQEVQLLTQKFEVRLRAANDEIRKLTQEHEDYAQSILQNKQRLYAEVQQDVLKSLDKHLQEQLSNGAAAPSCPAELVQLVAKFNARYDQHLAALRLEQPAADRPAVDARQSVELAAHEDQADFRQMARTMKELVCELAKYVTVCEDELNDTLVQQILRSADADATDAGDVMRDAAEESLSVSNGNTIPYLSMMSNLDSTECDGNKTLSDSLSNEMTYLSDNVSAAGEPGRARSPRRKVRRVHFAPNISNIVNMDEGSLVQYVGGHPDLAADIRAELDACLHRLKKEAASIVGRTGRKPSPLDTSAREELALQLSELELYRGECGRLTAKLDASRLRVAELEGREDVSEAYGEQGDRATAVQNMADLQDQARSILGECGDKTPQLRLIEELCREGDRLVDESKHERDDLQQQVAAADKQLRSTRRFLEEQAAEREQERDDFLAEIARLKEQLRSTDQLKADRLDKEHGAARSRSGGHSFAAVDTLEAQVKEATGLLKDADAKKDELEAELKAAIDKVWSLREIISDLETQVEVKARNETNLEEQVNELRTLVEQQTQSNHELSFQLDSGHGEMSAHISELEEQLRRHHQQMEQFQPESVRQMKTTLRDFETTLDKKTKDLESYVTHNSNASSPCLSEDVSIREQMDSVRSATPDGAPVSLPLAQLLRLQDKLAAHSRAEQAALKQIRDLDMEIAALRRDRDEALAERDSLQTQLGEQLLTISRLHANVDGQRQATAEQVSSACADLRKRWQAADASARELAAAADAKDKEIEASAVLLAETRTAAAAQESEWKAAVQREQDAANKLRAERTQLAAKLQQLEAASAELSSLRPTSERDARISALESDNRERQAVELELRLQLESRELRFAEMQAQLAALPRLEKEVRRLRQRLKGAAAAQEKVPAPEVNRHELGQAAPAPAPVAIGAVAAEDSPRNLYAALQKMLVAGIESLSPDELSSLHGTLETAIGKPAPPPEATASSDAPLDLDAAQLRSRVETLTNELAAKDDQAQQKLSRLKAAVEEARRDLERERHRADDLAAEHQRLLRETDSCAAAANSLQLQLESELSRVRALDAEMSRVKNVNKQLQSLLESERQRAIQSNLHESDLIASMRVKLEQCLESEAQLRGRLDKAERAEASRQREQLAQTHGANAPASPRTSANQRKELQEAVEREKVEAAGLELALKQQQRRAAQLEALVEKEKLAATQRVQAERDKYKKMRRQLQSVEEDKENLNVQLDAARDALCSQQLLCADLSRRLSDEAESAAARRERWTAEEQRLRSALAAADADHAALEERARELQARLTPDGRGARLDSPDGAANAALSAPMLQKLKAANALLEKHVAENVEVSLAMSRLTEDRQQLQDRVRQLEARLARSPARHRSADNEMEVVNELLAAERTTWSREKAALLHTLAQAEAAKRQRYHSDDADKMRHMFSKYLRVESYRKALAWQKRYLLIVISGYQNAGARALRQNGTAAAPGDNAVATATRPISRFRSCGVAIIAIHRMQFLVRRWKNGRSAGTSTVFIHGSTESLASATSSYLGARQRQGSSASAWSVSRGISSPPDSTRGGLEPIKVAEFIDRFDQLQQRLGLAVSPSTSTS